MKILGCAQPLPAFPAVVGQGGGELYLTEGLSLEGWAGLAAGALWFYHLLGGVVISAQSHLSLDPQSLTLAALL